MQMLSRLHSTETGPSQVVFIIQFCTNRLASQVSCFCTFRVTLFRVAAKITIVCNLMSM